MDRSDSRPDTPPGPDRPPRAFGMYRRAMQRAEAEAAAVPSGEPARDGPAAESAAPAPPAAPPRPASDAAMAPASAPAAAAGGAAAGAAGGDAGEIPGHAAPALPRSPSPRRASQGRSPAMAWLAVGLLLLPVVVVLSLWIGWPSASAPSRADDPAAATPDPAAGNSGAPPPADATVAPLPEASATSAPATGTTANPAPAPDPASDGPAAAVVEPLAPATPAPAPAAPARPDTRPAATEGQLVVVTEPPGASVTVNGIGHGAAPATVRFLPLGEHRVRVTQAGYRSEERVVRLTGGASSATVRITMRP